MEPRIRAHIRPNEVVNVNYRDVLDQAVGNERWRVIRQVRDILEAVDTMKPRSNSAYARDSKTAENYKGEVLIKLSALE